MGKSSKWMADFPAMFDQRVSEITTPIIMKLLDQGKHSQKKTPSLFRFPRPGFSIGFLCLPNHPANPESRLWAPACQVSELGTAVSSLKVAGADPKMRRDATARNCPAFSFFWHVGDKTKRVLGIYDRNTHGYIKTVCIYIYDLTDHDGDLFGIG